MYASGLRVLSEEYSKPCSNILTLLIFPISLLTGSTLAFFPLSVVMDESPGKDL